MGGTIDDTVYETVLQVIGTSDRIEFTDQLSLRGLDSLATVELTLTLEDKLGIVFSDEDLKPANFSTVASIIAIARSSIDK